MAAKPHPKSAATIFTKPEELPRFMTVYDVADCLRISVASAYTLSETDDFPVILFNCQRRVRREKFIEWLIGKERKVSWRQD